MKKRLTSHAWINDLNYADIKDKWDASMCIQFLMLSESTQKRLPGAPTPSKPCNVKLLACQRFLNFLTVKSTATTAPKKESPIRLSEGHTNSIIDTLNLLLGVIRRSFPAYPKTIQPIYARSGPETLNHEIKITHQHLLEMVYWLDDEQHCAQAQLAAMVVVETADEARLNSYFQ